MEVVAKGLQNVCDKISLRVCGSKVQSPRSRRQIRAMWINFPYRCFYWFAGIKTKQGWEDKWEDHGSGMWASTVGSHIINGPVLRLTIGLAPIPCFIHLSCSVSTGKFGVLTLLVVNYLVLLPFFSSHFLQWIECLTYNLLRWHRANQCPQCCLSSFVWSIRPLQIWESHVAWRLYHLSLS